MIEAFSITVFAAWVLYLVVGTVIHLFTRGPECNCCVTHTRHDSPCRDMENCRCCERRCPVHTGDLPEARVR